MNITHELKKFALAATIALIAVPAFAQTTATTDPVGFITYSLPGNADSYLYIPFKRNPDYAGATSGAVASNVIAASGTPNWGVNAFAPGASLQPRFYVLIRSGAKSGMFYAVSSNDSSTLTVDLGGDTISSDVVAGTAYQICAFDTLGSIFPSGQGVNGSAGHLIGARQSEVLIPESSLAGTNFAPASSYYYYNGATLPGAGWRLAGQTGTIVNDVVLYPDSYIIVRHNVATGTSLTTMGTVQMGQVQLPLTTLADNTNQDIPIGIPVAGNQTLFQSNLFQSGAFQGGASHLIGSRKDELLVWDNSFVGKNKAPDASYYYYTGTAGNGPGWRLAGDTINVRDAEIVITPGKAFTIRKKSTGLAATVFWKVTPTYVQ